MKKIILFALLLAIFLCACCEILPSEPATEATTLPTVTEAPTIITEPPTEPPTQAPTEAPAPQAETEAPTEPPTEVATEAAA